jgi:hypothetical protein
VDNHPTPPSPRHDEAEQWRPVIGYEGWYEVSDLGRVRRVKAGGHGTRYGKILKPNWNSSGRGHMFVVLSRHSVEKAFPVHRLVTNAFIGPLPDGLITRHLNGDKTDNRPVNLAYGTYAENAQDAIRHGRNHNAAKTHCKYGHEFTPENIKRIPSRPNTRFCLECHRIENREAMRKKRARARALRLGGRDAA